MLGKFIKGALAAIVSIPLLVACSGSTVESPTSGAATTGGAPTAETAATPDMSSCLAEMPVYPGAEPDPDRTSSMAATVESLAGSNDWTHGGISPTDAQVYVSDAATDDVVEFYASSMETAGWESSRSRPGTNWGFERWARQSSYTQMLVGFNNGQTVIVLGCLTATGPSDTSASPAGSGCLANIPAYVGASADPQASSDVNAIIERLGFTPEMLGAEAVVYMTADSKQDVVTFYSRAMAAAGWEEVLALSGDESDFIAWEQGDLKAQLLAGDDGGRTVIVLGCSTD